MRVPVNAQLRGGTFLGNEYFLATWISLSLSNCRIGITMVGLKTTPKTLKKKRKWTYLAEMKTLVRKMMVNSTVPAKKPALTAKVGR